MARLPPRPFTALFAALQLAGVVAAAEQPSQGTLQELQVVGYGPFASHLDHFRTQQALARVDDRIVAVGATAGGMCRDNYEQARSWTVEPTGKLADGRAVASHARALVVRDGTVHAIAFDDPSGDDECLLEGATDAGTTHVETFTLDGSGAPKLSVRAKPPLEYTRYLRWIVPLSRGILLLDWDTKVTLLSGDATRVLATNGAASEVLSLVADGDLAALATADGRVRLLDLTNGLAVRAEWAEKGVRHLALGGTTLYTYAADGRLSAFDVSAPATHRVRWTRRIAPVAQSTGLVVDGARLLVSGFGLAEVPADGSGPGTFFRTTGRWKKLSSIIPAGDVVYAFNEAASRSKVLVLKLVRPR